MALANPTQVVAVILAQWLRMRSLLARF